MKRPRIVLADDQTVMLEALKNLLEPEFEVVGIFADGLSLVEAAPKLVPDVAVVDIGMPNMNGLLAGQRLKQLMPTIRLIYLTMNNDPDIAAEAFKLGASAYLVKNSAASELVRALRDVMRGGSYVTPLLTKDMVGSFIQNIKQGTPPHEPTLEDIMNRALAEIVGGFCHDIGNYLDVCRIHMEARRYAKARKVRDDAAESLRGLHEFVRQYYSGESFRPSAVGASSIESVVRETCRHAIRETNITVHVESSGFSRKSSLPTLLLRHLIVPLAHNAAEAIASVKGCQGHIWLSLSLERPGNVVCMTVEDNGIGWKGRNETIEAALKNGNPISTKGNNRGFGLQNIWHLASRLGGDVKLCTSLHGGARVVVFFELKHKKPTLELTPRQKEVLQLIAEGRSMKEAAFILNVSQRTVAFHKYTMMEYFKVNSNAELIQYAIKNLLLTSD
ncbi:MAG TPA: response regulator [Pyrinomonadaceae bacterium]